MKAWIVHAHMKITATFAPPSFFIMTVVISGAILEGHSHPQCLRPQCEGQ